MKFFLTTFHPRPILRNTMNLEGRKIHEFVFFSSLPLQTFECEKKRIIKRKIIRGGEKKRRG